MEILSALNDNQREAVTYCDGPQLVIAGAGSGKTRVLTYKIAYLLDHHQLQPWSILALTFTNKAAREMKARIGSLVGEERARYLQMGTFHSIFARLLRSEAQTIGYSSDFTIYDESDSRSLIKNICKQMMLDEKTYKPAAVHAAISMAKNRLQSAEGYAADGDMLSRDRQRNMPEIHKIFLAYDQRLRQANAMDFDDLLVNTYRMLADHEELRRKYADRFQYVLVDEYQDTNYAQQQIVTLLTRDHRHICVVGDDYQSIYAFRGAKIDNILKFQQIYEDAKMFKLEQNYRSTQRIVAAANSLMKHNQMQIPKEVFSENAEGEKITVFETISDKREAAIVCREMRRLKKEEGLSWNDFAILYRTNAQSRTFEEEMRKPEVGMGGCYRIYGGLSFYQRKEIKDIIAYLRLVVNPDDEEAFRRIINYPTRGIGDTTVQKIAASAQEHHISLWDVISSPDGYGLAVNKGTLGKLDRFRLMIEMFQQQAKEMDAYTLVQELMTQAGINADLTDDKTIEGDARRENVDQLMAAIAEFVEAQQEEGHGEEIYLKDYLATVSLLTDADSDDPTQEKVTMMTIHAAKGLEFPVVFIVGMEENIFPSAMSQGSSRELEEERRLLYVAITRAEKHCYLSWAHSRWMYGKMDSFVNPSRFLNDIDKKYLSTQVEGGGSNGYGAGYGSSAGYGFGGRGGSYGSGRRKPWEDDGQTSRRPWEEDYEPNRPYKGTSRWQTGDRRLSSRMQNSRPVGDRFMADPQPKITSPKRPEAPVNPFSPEFEEKLKQGGRWKRVSAAMSNGGRQASGMSSSMRPAASSGAASSSAQTTASSPATTAHAVSGVGLTQGSVVEHQRFGRGTVEAIEGTGENRKATIVFEQTGRKQLLLKFAKLTIVR